MTWTRRETVVGGGAALTALALAGCKSDPAPGKSGAGGTTDDPDGPVALESERITASLTSVLSDSPCP
jgi:hypothetical protein